MRLRRAPSCVRRHISSGTLKPRFQRRLRGPKLAPKLVLGALLVTSSASAAEAPPDAAPVIVLQPTTASAALRRSLARIRNELSADQFHVILAESVGAIDPPAVIESAARDPAGGTVLALFGDPETGVAELCVVQRSGRRVAVRRATVAVDDPERMPEALSARALELLRASALELAIDSEGARRSQAAPEPNRTIETAAHPGLSVAAAEDAAVVVDMGVGMLHSIDGPPPAVIPVGRIRARVWSWLGARLSVAGLGSRPRVDSRYGSATLSQSLALFELAGGFRSGKRVRLAASLGAGALNVSVAGIGAGRYEGRDSQRWSAAFGGGLGVTFAIGPRAALATELQALVASPHPIVRFVDTPVATVGYPSLLLTVGLQVML
jgi:hypothetical protein